MRVRITWQTPLAALAVTSLAVTSLAVTSLGCRSGSSESSSEKTASSDEASDEQDLPDDWWEEDEEGEEDEGEGEGGEGEEDWDEEEDWEDDGDGEEGSFWYGYVEDGSAEETNGEVGWVDEGCEWYANVSGVATDLCSDCSAAFIVTVGAAYIEDDAACDGSIEDLTEQDFTIGFSGSEALVYEDGSWEAFAEAFYEGSAMGWFSEL